MELGTVPHRRLSADFSRSFRPTDRPPGVWRVQLPSAERQPLSQVLRITLNRVLSLTTPRDEPPLETKTIILTFPYLKTRELEAVNINARELHRQVVMLINFTHGGLSGIVREGLSFTLQGMAMKTREYRNLTIAFDNGEVRSLFFSRSFGGFQTQMNSLLGSIEEPFKEQKEKLHEDLNTLFDQINTGVLTYTEAETKIRELMDSIQVTLEQINSQKHEASFRRFQKIQQLLEEDILPKFQSKKELVDIGSAILSTTNASVMRVEIPPTKSILTSPLLRGRSAPVAPRFEEEFLELPRLSRSATPFRNIQSQINLDIKDLVAGVPLKASLSVYSANSLSPVQKDELSLQVKKLIVDLLLKRLVEGLTPEKQAEFIAQLFSCSINFLRKKINILEEDGNRREYFNFNEENMILAMKDEGFRQELEKTLALGGRESLSYIEFMLYLASE